MSKVESAKRGIGRAIAQAREAKGMNQSELARELGVTPQAVQKWESDASLPRPTKVADIAAVLGIGPWQLLPVDMPVTSAQSVTRPDTPWPFRTSYARLEKLPPDELERIDDYIAQSVERWEGRRKAVTQGIAGARRLEKKKKTGSDG
jgi:transcriptional regulator with XRE-family HTH domain